MTATSRPNARSRVRSTSRDRQSGPISIEAAATVRSIEVSGLVLNRACRPVARVLVDLWHADENGDYDNGGFRYRGPCAHRRGRAAIASAPSCRRPIRAARATSTSRCCRPGRQLLTTQLYFPDEPLNRRDELFRRELLMRVADGGRSSVGAFRFRARSALAGQRHSWPIRIVRAAAAAAAASRSRCRGTSSIATRGRWRGGSPRPDRSTAIVSDHPRRPGAGRDRRARARHPGDRDRVRGELPARHPGRASRCSRRSRRRSSGSAAVAARAC